MLSLFFLQGDFGIVGGKGDYGVLGEKGIQGEFGFFGLEGIEGIKVREREREICMEVM